MVLFCWHQACKCKIILNVFSNITQRTISFCFLSWMWSMDKIFDKFNKIGIMYNFVPWCHKLPMSIWFLAYVYIYLLFIYSLRHHLGLDYYGAICNFWLRHKRFYLGVHLGRFLLNKYFTVEICFFSVALMRLLVTLGLKKKLHGD